MKLNPFYGIMPLLLLFLSTSCKKEAQDNGAELESVARTSSSSANAAQSDLIKSVRKATARFHSTTQAIKAGYQPSTHCVGGMGYHWVNPTLVDPAFDPLQPEALLYATGPDGNLRLVAVEYIVIKANQPWPMFGTQPFDDNGTPVPVPHWSLHVWMYEHNPSGMFTPFNPSITCP